MPSLTLLAVSGSAARSPARYPIDVRGRRLPPLLTMFPPRLAGPADNVIPFPARRVPLPPDLKEAAITALAGMFRAEIAAVRARDEGRKNTS